MLLTRPHRKWLCYFVPYGHGKSDLRFVHGGAKKCIELLLISKAKIAEENNFTTSFGEIGSFICRHIYLCKQLLLQINSCCQVVMKNNEMTSPWSSHCRMLVASRKTTTR